MLGAAMLFVIKSIASFLVMRRAYRFLAGRQAVVSGSMAACLLSLRLLYVRRRTTQETSYALTQGVNAAMIGVLGSGVVIASEAAVLLVLLGGLLALNVMVALFTLGFFGLTGIIVYRLVGMWGQRSGTALSEVEVTSVESIQNVLHAYREFTVSGRRSHFVEEFRGLRWEAAGHQANMQVLGQLTKYVFELALIIGAGLLSLFLFATESSAAAVATLVMFLAATSRITPSLLRLQQAALTMRMADGMAAPTLALATELRMSTPRVVSDPETLDSPQAKSELSPFVPTISVSSVSLTYPGVERPAISDVCLEVQAGSSLALVGPSGAGKSTLVDVLLGILEQDRGQVRLGGASPEEAIAAWPGAIAYVPQDVTLVRGTIRDNVTLGLPRALVDDEHVWRALRSAQLEQVIRASPGALDAEVGERGVRLSGGQRQRLGLARALYTGPKLLFLDEATSALDAETENAVSSALRNLGSAVTVVIVAHRLATVRDCDQVAYLEDGIVMAVGSFEYVRACVPRFDHQAGLLGL
jgi:ABC-type multidrug transport system fused ATPase/permease subunit